MGRWNVRNQDSASLYCSDGFYAVCYPNNNRLSDHGLYIGKLKKEVGDPKFIWLTRKSLSTMKYNFPKSKKTDTSLWYVVSLCPCPCLELNSFS